MHGEAPDPITICRMLATDDRLRIAAALILGARTVDALSDVTGLLPKDLLQALNRLTAAGLVESDGDHGWRFRSNVFEDAVRAGVEDEEEPEHDYHGVSDAKQAAVLRVFMPAGRLVAFPASRVKRRMVLDQVARVFEPGVHYPEREVNVILRAICMPPDAAHHGDAYAPAPDHATLRRYLVDEGYLTREAGVYWRTGGTFEVG